MVLEILARVAAGDVSPAVEVLDAHLVGIGHMAVGRMDGGAIAGLQRGVGYLVDRVSRVDVQNDYVEACDVLPDPLLPSVLQGALDIAGADLAAEFRQRQIFVDELVERQRPDIPRPVGLLGVPAEGDSDDRIILRIRRFGLASRGRRDRIFVGTHRYYSAASAPLQGLAATRLIDASAGWTPRGRFSLFG